MLCNLCMKDVDFLIPIKEHKREHPMTYVVTREICLVCLMGLDPVWWEILKKLRNQEKPKKAKKEGKDNAS